MKKIIICLIILIGSFSQTHAQDSIPSLPKVRIGIKLAGSFIYNRVNDNDNTFDVDRDGTAFKGAFGVMPEFLFGGKYYFSTGLIYQPKGIELKGSDNTENFTEGYRIQYLQIPFGLKLLTNNINDRLKAYINLGPALDIKIGDNIDQDKVLLDDLNAVDLSLFLGVGIELGQIGNMEQTFGFGLQYMRGLIDNVDSGANVEIKTDMWNIELLIYF
ncbi:porin family protein [Sediminitomix flava]|uniref:Outer membrane protein with beta-barrel domain n=1 Tax=Sediminitomix flava TaxID=379075 RepID=A0A315Z045_SEDFL|nr:porin family protein [Sediminitomix flava]PWJ36037.1 outer membrane protein with beta-barrel domain [Sediminitomix flava]